MASRVKGYKLERLHVNNLEYDLRNPRFKGFSTTVNSQSAVERLIKVVPGIEELQESISKIGVVEPLYAVQKDAHKYRVIEGNQRLFVQVTPPEESKTSARIFLGYYFDIRCTQEYARARNNEDTSCPATNEERLARPRRGSSFLRNGCE